MLSAWIRNFALFGFFLAVLLNQAFGSKAVLLFLAFGFVAIGWRKRFRMVPVDTILLWGLYSVLALISVVWSLQSGATLRGAIQFILCNVLVIVIAHYFPIRSFYLAAGGALLAVIFLSVLFPRTGLAPGIGGGLEVVNIGMFGSKNQYGLAAAFALMFGPFVSMSRETFVFRLLGVALTLMGLVGVSQAVSYGATVVAFLTLCMTVALWLFAQSGVTRPARLVVFTLGAAITVCLLMVLFGYWEQILAYFGKDATLTGRTEWWAAGSRAIQEKPMLGVGFQGFWRVGNPEAEDLLRQMGIPFGTHMGFNFHNQFFDVWVQLGLIGLSIFCLIIAKTLKDLFRVAVSKFTVYDACAMCVCIFLIVRCSIESNLLNQFDFTHLMFVGASFYLAERSKKAIQSMPETGGLDVLILRQGIKVE